jgi:two-component system phosphate regulon response regulator PhoB
LAKLKSHEETKDIPVLMLTAKGQMDDVALALGAGADDYITKPFNPEKLGRVLKKKLEYAKVRRKRDRRREKARTGGLCSAPW